MQQVNFDVTPSWFLQEEEIKPEAEPIAESAPVAPKKAPEVEPKKPKEAVDEEDIVAEVVEKKVLSQWIFLRVLLPWWCIQTLRNLDLDRDQMGCVILCESFHISLLLGHGPRPIVSHWSGTCLGPHPSSAQCEYTMRSE